MKYLFLLAFLVAISLFSRSQEVEKPNNLIQKTAEEMIMLAKLGHAAFSFYVIDLGTGEVVADYNAEMSLPSASTMKLVTSCTALQILGRAYRFRTKIMYSGDIDSSGTLNGDLYIIGGGDPTLGSKYFNKTGKERDFLYQWADSVYSIGIRKVNGHVIADGSIYSYQGIPSGWAWGDMGNYYGAGPSGLAIFDNLCTFHFETGEMAGDSTLLTCITPHIPGIHVKNYVVSADSKKDNAYVYGAPWSYDWIVRGSIPKKREDFKVKASMPDPEMIAALEFGRALEEKGIDVMYSVRTFRELSKNESFMRPEFKEIYIHSSPYLSTIINVMNRRSINLFAEHILCQLAVKPSGYGSTYDGALICMRYWGRKIGYHALNMTDGSGLSRSNSVSAKFLVDMLAYMNASENIMQLEASMALAGKRGTMSGMCKGTPASGRVYGKSGTMTRVKSYAGYVKTTSGKKLGYAMIINNHHCSNSQISKYFGKLMVEMATY